MLIATNAAVRSIAAFMRPRAASRQAWRSDPSAVHGESSPRVAGRIVRVVALASSVAASTLGRALLVDLALRFDRGLKFSSVVSREYALPPKRDLRMSTAGAPML
jgi:hypothetical protein